MSLEIKPKFVLFKIQINGFPLVMHSSGELTDLDLQRIAELIQAILSVRQEQIRRAN